MRHGRLPLHSAQRRAQLLSATQVAAIAFVTLALVLAGADVLMTSYRGGVLLAIAVLGAIGLSALHACLVRCSQTAFRWSLVALGCLAAVAVITRMFAHPAAVAVILSLSALVAMLLSIQASSPRVRAGIIDAIDKDTQARMARARALSFADTDR
jgi:hypothetical protein